MKTDDVLSWGAIVLCFSLIVVLITQRDYSEQCARICAKLEQGGWCSGLRWVGTEEVKMEPVCSKEVLVPMKDSKAEAEK